MTAVGRLLSRASAMAPTGGGGRLARNSALYVGDRLFSAILNFVTFALIARTYGPSDMGRWSYAVAAVYIITPMIPWSAEPAVIRELANNPARRLSILGSAALLILASTTVTLGLTVLWVWLEVGASDIFWISVVFGAASLLSLVQVIEHELKGSMMARAVVTIHMASASVGAALRISLTLHHVDLAILAASYIVEASALAVLLLIVAVRRGEGPGRWRCDRATLRDIGRQALPLALSLLVINLFFRLNFFLLARLSTFDQVGKFALASSIVQAVGIIPPAVSTAVYPRLLVITQEDRGRAIQILRWIVYAFTAAGYGVCGLCIVAAPLLPFIFGPRYDGMQWILVILSTTIVFTFSGAARALLINIESIPRYHLVSAVVGLVSVGIGSALAIPRFGAEGAAFVQAVASALSAVVTTSFFPRTRVLAGAQFASLILVPPRGAGPLGTIKAAGPT